MNVVPDGGWVFAAGWVDVTGAAVVPGADVDGCVGADAEETGVSLTVVEAGDRPVDAGDDVLAQPLSTMAPVRRPRSITAIRWGGGYKVRLGVVMCMGFPLSSEPAPRQRYSTDRYPDIVPPGTER